MRDDTCSAFLAADRGRGHRPQHGHKHYRCGFTQPGDRTEPNDVARSLGQMTLTYALVSVGVFALMCSPPLSISPLPFQHRICIPSKKLQECPTLRH